MKCIVCDKEKKLLGPDTETSLHPCISGTMFEARGNYGSTIWDMEGRKYLQIVICDDCLKAKADQVDVVIWGMPYVPAKKLVSRLTFEEHSKNEDVRYEKINLPYREALSFFKTELEAQGFKEFAENRSKGIQAAFPAPTQGTYLQSSISTGTFDFKTPEVGTHIKARINPDYVRLTYSIRAGTISRKLLFSDDWQEALASFIQEAEKPFG